MMFATQLRDAREAAGLSIAEVAELSGTSRAAITDYELGVKRPRVDTADRVLRAVGRQLVDVSLPRTPRKWSPLLDRHAMAAIELWRTEKRAASEEARRVLPSVLEAHAAAERLQLGWGQLRAIADGRTVNADPFDVRRARTIATAALQAIKRAQGQQPIRLRIIVNDVLVVEDPQLPVTHRAVEFLARAVANGADPALTLCLVNGALIRDGIPWLFPNFKMVDAFRAAIVACAEADDAGPLLRVLADNVNARRFTE